MRNRRRIQRRGPLIVYSKNEGIRKAFRNIPGVDLINVSKLDLLKVAPGGHVGRFLIWTESAFKTLNALYGSWDKASRLKKGFNLPQPKMSNTDLTRLMKSEEIQNVLRKPRKGVRRAIKKLNPLTNSRAMLKLNPFAAVVKREGILLAQKRIRERRALLAEKRGLKKGEKSKVEVKKKLSVKKEKLLKKKTLRLEGMKKARKLRQARIAKDGKITPKFVKKIVGRKTAIRASSKVSKECKAERIKKRLARAELIEKALEERRKLLKQGEVDKFKNRCIKTRRTKKRIVNKSTPKAISLRQKIIKAKAMAKLARTARAAKLIKLKKDALKLRMKQKLKDKRAAGRLKSAEQKKKEAKSKVDVKSKSSSKKDVKKPVPQKKGSGKLTQKKDAAKQVQKKDTGKQAQKKDTKKPVQKKDTAKPVPQKKDSGKAPQKKETGKPAQKSTPTKQAK